MLIGSFMCFILTLVTGTLGNVTSEVEDGKPLLKICNLNGKLKPVYRIRVFTCHILRRHFLYSRWQINALKLIASYLVCKIIF
jgi:hypothetical protein